MGWVCVGGGGAEHLVPKALGRTFFQPRNACLKVISATHCSVWRRYCGGRTNFPWRLLDSGVSAAQPQHQAVVGGCCSVQVSIQHPRRTAGLKAGYQNQNRFTIIKIFLPKSFYQSHNLFTKI